MTDPLLRFRPEFPILERKTYLVSNSLGAMPRRTEKRLAEYAAIWNQEGIGAWEKEWWELPRQTGDEIAPLIGAGPGQVTMATNVSQAQAAVLSAIPFSAKRNKIVMTAMDFPSVRYVYESLAPRFGATIEVIPSDDGIGVDEQRVINAIDESTALVAISHVLYRSAYIMDVGAVCRRAHEKGALVSLDSFHAVGTIPVDVAALGVHFLTGGVLKWLCGGPGGAFLYVDPATGNKLKPSFTGWLAHARPFEFEDEMEFAEGSWRWLSGTPAIPALYAAREGPRIVREAGIEHIRQKSRRQTARVVELAQERGFQINSSLDPERRGGTVSIFPPGAYDIYRHLLARNVLIDYRPAAGIRVAPHFYTDDSEIEKIFEQIDDLMSATGQDAVRGSSSVST